MSKELTLHTLVTNTDAHKKPKRKGRGIAAGCGKTAGRGTKGQKSRSSGGVRPGFEGGQNPWFRRLPKRGFKNPSHKEYVVINLDTINKHFQDNDTVTLDSLRKKGLVPLRAPRVKLLARGKLIKKVTFDLPFMSRAARIVASKNKNIKAPKIIKPSLEHEK